MQYPFVSVFLWNSTSPQLELSYLDPVFLGLPNSITASPYLHLKVNFCRLLSKESMCLKLVNYFSTVLMLVVSKGHFFKRLPAHCMNLVATYFC